MKTVLYCRHAVCFFWLALGAANLALSPSAQAGEPRPVRVLFLGDNAGHRPAERFKTFQPVMAQRNIEVVYTESLNDLNPSRLAGFDCLLIYANHTRISPEQESALLDFVAAGGGFVPIHSASYCFLNSPKYVELVGAQFQRHGDGVFQETHVQPDHPVLEGLSPIESWDETYVHTRHNPDRIVLAERRDAQGAEPWTWVREHGQGRVFYTAWGHDHRTWSNPGFIDLVENGIRWSSENSPNQVRQIAGLPPLEYMEAPDALPNYVPGRAWGTQAEPIRTMQKPLAPSESLKRLALLPEFEATLFASEPDIVNPIWMSWDERGRLWIAETVDYPNELQPLGEGRDRIIICEDTNADGRADQFTVFADKLSIPTGFVFANGGLIVIHSGLTEFLRDTTGDDRADERKVLFSGWNMRDTHATASNLRYGFDNWIWGVVGYSGFRGAVGGTQHQFGQGIFRFKPDGSELEFIRSSNNNTWGLGLTEDNIVIGSTANGNAAMYMPIPNRYYERVNGWSPSRLETIADSQLFYPITDKVRQVDYHGRYTAGSGSAIYTARAFPPDYWNKVQFVAEPTGHLLGKFHLRAVGADFIAHNGRNFTASDDEWTSPVVAEVGPDGALWVIDWYNYIIQHNPTPRGFRTGKGAAYETPLRDTEHGRIIRIAHNGSRPAETSSAPLRLDRASPGELVAALKNDNMLWRMHAQERLVTRGQKDVVPALIQLTADNSVDDIGLNPAAIHALWTLHGLGALDGSDSSVADAAVAALNHPSASVRRAAAMVLPRNESSRQALLEKNLLDDSDAQTRMAALLALADMPPSDPAGGAIFAMLQKPENSEDRWIPDAATSAAARNDAGFLKAVLARYEPAPVEGATAASPGNLLPNPSFEELVDGGPSGWRTVTHGGRAEFGVADFGRTGNRSVRISSSQGADASWSSTIPVRPRTDYRLSAWIKTENVRKLGNAHGAMLNIHELQDPVQAGTKPLTGDNDWTQVELIFNSGQMRRITVNCLFGGWGRAAGTAWFDDIELTVAPGSELAGELGRVTRLVTRHYALRGPVESILPTLMALEGASESLAVPILDGLVSGWPEDTAPALGEKERQQLTSLMAAMPESVRDRLLALSQRWGETELFGENVAAIINTLKNQITSAAQPDDQRVAAARRLVGLADEPAMIAFVLDQIDLLAPPALASGFINALAASRSAETGEAIVAHWPRLSPATQRVAVTALMRRPEWTRSLLDGVDKGPVDRTQIAAEHWAQLRQNPNRMISRRAERLATATAGFSADREEIVNQLLPLVQLKGDVSRGEQVYEANCAACHTLNGAGGKIGPDLTGIGARDRTEVLIKILDPNRSVEANYRLWTAETKDGDIYSGRLEAETQTTVEILDVAGQKHVLQRADIATLESSPTSIMPIGFEALPQEDLASLLDFLGQAHF